MNRFTGAVIMAVVPLLLSAQDVGNGRRTTMEADVLMEHVNVAIKLCFVGRMPWSIALLRDVMKNAPGSPASAKAHAFLDSLGYKGRPDDQEEWLGTFRKTMTPNEFLDHILQSNYQWRQKPAKERNAEAVTRPVAPPVPAVYAFQKDVLSVGRKTDEKNDAVGNPALEAMPRTDREVMVRMRVLSDNLEQTPVTVKVWSTWMAETGLPSVTVVQVVDAEGVVRGAKQLSFGGAVKDAWCGHFEKKLYVYVTSEEPGRGRRLTAVCEIGPDLSLTEQGILVPQRE